jgi:DNA-binding PadR family transcriptional regulator
LKPKDTDIAILSLIDTKSSHPSKIARDLRKDRRTIHRHLTPMEKDGLIEGLYSQDRTANRPMIIKEYRLTSKGRERLAQMKVLQKRAK